MIKIAYIEGCSIKDMFPAEDLSWKPLFPAALDFLSAAAAKGKLRRGILAESDTASVSSLKNPKQLKNNTSC